MKRIIKTIYLARHAKSAWDTGAVTDYDRPLSKRGKKDAKHMALELARLQWRPEKVISSPALRARQTCLFLCEGLNLSTEMVTWDNNIYAAYMVTLLQILTSLPEALRSVMLVGHNPAMEDLLEHLCTRDLLHSKKQSNGKLFTTGNIAKLEISVSWKDMVMHEAQLDALLRPKELN